MGLRQAYDSRGTFTQASTSPRKDATRTGSRTDKTGTAREEANRRYQEECEARADGRGESPGKGFGANEELHQQVLPDADAIAGDFFAHTDGTE